METVGRLGVPASGPLYRAARARLLTALAQGDYPPGTALPPEKTLSAGFGISIGTLRKAVDELVAEGMLIRQQGRGTFVASHDRERLLYYFFHVVPIDGGKTMYPVVDLIEFARARADASTAAKLGIAPGAAVFLLRNRLSLGGTALMIDDITLPAERFRGLSAARIRQREGTLYQLYQDQFGLSITGTTERLRAVAAPPDIAALLGLAARTPMLMIRRVAHGYAREPLEWRVSHIDTRLHEYFSEHGA